MEELRLIGVSDDGSQLILEWSGEQFALAVDDQLRAAVHPTEQPAEPVGGEPQDTPEADPVPITPREIQARVRAGAAPADVADDAGVPVEHVLRFAGPVVQEREHIADRGRRARLGAASGPAPLLEDVVTHALARRGVDVESVAWDAARLDDGTWTVLVRWEEAPTAARFTASTGRATWRLDASRQQASPHDDEASRLTAREPEISAVGETAPEAAGGTEGLSVVSPFVPRLATATEPAPDSAAASGPESQRKRDTLVLETTPHLPDQTSEPDAPDERDEDEPSRRSPAARKGKRASVPAWDDIMFGPGSNRPDDEPS